LLLGKADHLCEIVRNTAFSLHYSGLHFPSGNYILRTENVLKVVGYKIATINHVHKIQCYIPQGKDGKQKNH